MVEISDTSWLPQDGEQVIVDIDGKVYTIIGGKETK